MSLPGLSIIFATSNDYLDLLFELALMNFPVVVLDKKIHDLPFATIQSDNFAGGKTATERLIGLGHTKLDISFQEVRPYNPFGNVI